jgi:hypothetical protein
VKRGKQWGVVSSFGPKPKARPNKKTEETKKGEKWAVPEATNQV